MKNVVIILSIGMLSSISYARDDGQHYFPADGFLDVRTSGSEFRTNKGVAEFCAWAQWKDKPECKWVRAEEYIRFKLKRDDIQYVGMSHGTYTSTLTLYFREI